MSFVYPYESDLRKELQQAQAGSDYRIWQIDDLQGRIADIDKPIVDIGGPTSGGFYFLDKMPLPSRPVITNISSNPQPYSPDAQKLSEEVEVLMDATNMPYADKSIGMFLMAAMSISSDWWVELPDDEKDKVEPIFKAESTNARYEMGQVAAGILEPSDVKNAQRVKIYLEVARCLQKNGLFFTDGGIEEIAILKSMGFGMVACLQVEYDHGMSYEFVVEKKQ